MDIYVKTIFPSGQAAEFGQVQEGKFDCKKHTLRQCVLQLFSIFCCQFLKSQVTEFSS